VPPDPSPAPRSTRILPQRIYVCCHVAFPSCRLHRGVASFDLVRHHRANDRMFLYAFDLIELNGDDIRRDPLQVRKATLASILAEA
jgi:hypothetical protein